MKSAISLVGIAKESVFQLLESRFKHSLNVSQSSTGNTQSMEIKLLLAACAASHAAGSNSANHFKSDIYDPCPFNTYLI